MCTKNIVGSTIKIQLLDSESKTSGWSKTIVAQKLSVAVDIDCSFNGFLVLIGGYAVLGMHRNKQVAQSCH